MTKLDSPEVIERSATEIPTIFTTPMSRNDKLERWASLIEKAAHSIFIYNELERWCDADLACTDRIHSRSAFALAIDDPIFGDAGLTDPSIKGVIGFMDLTKEQVHAFSCNCGGNITNTEMAERVRGMKAPEMSHEQLHNEKLALIIPIVGLGTMAATALAITAALLA